MKNFLLQLIFISFALVSCKTTNQSSNSQPFKNYSNFSSPIQIRFGEQLFFEDNLEVTFQSVLNDSRCPQNVQCAWQGNAEIILTIKNADKSISEFVNLVIDGKNDRNSSNHQVINSNNYNFILLELNPYPQTNQNNNFMSYEALISIEKL
ncbi:MAG: hypothetical protein DWQ06_07535 [Calditrichaeota bacterium]|nr:MAG: hypothetical protein DWQ06_07535 [Calditrichota bacterium]